MKKLSFLLLIALSLSAYTSKGQAFDRNTRIITLGFGGADMFHIPAGYAPPYASFFSPITGEIYVQGEFAVHRYVGVGFTTGIGGRGGGIATPAGIVYRGYYPEINIPIGLITNFHFYQLIADKKSGKNLHADKLDIYAGLSVGSGIAIHPGGYYDAKGKHYTGAFNDALFFIGPQIGIRYFFTDQIGINGEFGYGKTFAMVGITFKLNHGTAARK